MNYLPLIALILAHFLGDFVFQPAAWVRSKNTRRIRSPFLYLHTFVHGLLLAIVFVWQGLPWAGWWILTFSHLVIDLVKIYLPQRFIYFILDQVLHLLLILLVWMTIYHLYPGNVLSWFSSEQVLLVLLAYILVWWPCGLIIERVTESWREEISSSTKGLPNAGLWIGRLERFIILTLAVLNQFEVIGFVIATKSIFRFGDLTEGKNNKKTEYILFGSLLSFAMALVIGVLCRIILGKLG